VLTVGTTNESNREAWVRRQLERLPAGWRILDAGAGEQRYRRYCGHLEYVAQDSARYDPSASRVGLQMDKWDYAKLDVVSDIAALPAPDRSFEAVLCAEVLEHVPDPVRVLGEIARVLKPGGVLLLTAPFCSLTHFAPHHFSTGFSRFWYEKHLPDAGLEIEEIVPNGDFFEYLAQEVRRLPEIMERYAARRAGLLDRAGKRLLLRLLQACASADGGSAELLCHGFHVRGRKETR
jgi:ubiquinone/menaquinone biosynthesis C-methylase UbiE